MLKYMVQQNFRSFVLFRFIVAPGFKLSPCKFPSRLVLWFNHKKGHAFIFTMWVGIYIEWSVIKIGHSTFLISNTTLNISTALEHYNLFSLLQQLFTMYIVDNILNCVISCNVVCQSEVPIYKYLVIYGWTVIVGTKLMSQNLRRKQWVYQFV